MKHIHTPHANIRKDKVLLTKEKFIKYDSLCIRI